MSVGGLEATGWTQAFGVQAWSGWKGVGCDYRGMKARPSPIQTTVALCLQPGGREGMGLLGSEKGEEEESKARSSSWI